jgi:hypothetical protein
MMMMMMMIKKLKEKFGKIIIIIIIIIKKKLKEKFGSCTRKTLDSFTTKDSYTWNITHNTESTAV